MPYDEAEFFAYVQKCSQTSLGNLNLSRLNREANLLKRQREILGQIMEELIQNRAELLLIQWQRRGPKRMGKVRR